MSFTSHSSFVVEIKVDIFGARVISLGYAWKIYSLICMFPFSSFISYYSLVVVHVYRSISVRNLWLPIDGVYCLFLHVKWDKFGNYRATQDVTSWSRSGARLMPRFKLGRNRHVYNRRRASHNVTFYAFMQPCCRIYTHTYDIKISTYRDTE